MRKFQALIGAIAICAIAFTTGCAFNAKQVNATATVAKIAAKDATILSLEQHPEWKAQFQKAEDDLNILANAEKIDLQALVQIINRLPVKELKGKTAQLIVGDVTIVIEDITQNSATIITAEQYANIRTVVIALRDGLKLGLDTAQ